MHVVLRNIHSILKIVRFRNHEEMFPMYYTIVCHPYVRVIHLMDVFLTLFSTATNHDDYHTESHEVMCSV